MISIKLSRGAKNSKKKNIINFWVARTDFPFIFIIRLISSSSHPITLILPVSNCE